MHLHNIIVVPVIPEFTDIGGPWRVLPQGTHMATIDEVERRFGRGTRRARLFEGLINGVEALVEAGCNTIFIDGSFVTEKESPGDFDVCWDPTGVDESRLDPVFFSFADGRREQKEKFRDEFFPSSASADGVRTFVEYFQIDRFTGKRRGIVQLRLSSDEVKS